MSHSLFFVGEPSGPLPGQMSIGRKDCGNIPDPFSGKPHS